MYLYVRDNEASKVDQVDFEVFELLVGTAFSRWRAAFLADAWRQPHIIQSDLEGFLGRLVADNTIQYTDDVTHNSWTVGYYLDNAKYRLLDCLKLLANDSRAKPIRKSITSLPLQGVKRIETRDEWDATHKALRKTFDVLVGS
jgi:hypothetical protein